jgi:hypothetical protein
MEKQKGRNVRLSVQEWVMEVTAVSEFIRPNLRAVH